MNVAISGNYSNQTTHQFHNSRELWTVIGILTILSNLVLLVCIANSKFTRNLFHVLVGSTFMIGILYGIFFVFPMYSYSKYIHVSKYCTIMPMLSSAFTFNYILHHLLICIDQYYRIRWPRYYRKFNGKKRWMIIIVALWFIAHLIVAIPIMVFPQLQPWQCYHQVNASAHHALFYIFIIVLFIVPTGVITVIYSLMYYKIHKKYSKVSSFSLNMANRKRPMKKNKAHITAMRMGVLALIFFLMVYPFAIPMLAIYFRYRDNWLQSILDVTRYTAVFYSALNPLLYSCLIRTVQRSLMDNMYKLQQLLSKFFEIDT